MVYKKSSTYILGTAKEAAAQLPLNLDAQIQSNLADYLIPLPVTHRWIK